MRASRFWWVSILSAAMFWGCHSEKGNLLEWKPDNQADIREDWNRICVFAKGTVEHFPDSTVWRNRICEHYYSYCFDLKAHASAAFFRQLRTMDCDCLDYHVFANFFHVASMDAYLDCPSLKRIFSPKAYYEEIWQREHLHDGPAPDTIVTLPDSIFEPPQLPSTTAAPRSY